MSDHASVAAAITAGYIKTQTDMGAAFKGNRFRTLLEKPIIGEPGKSGSMLRAYGESSVDAATADAQALAALNGARNVTYGTGAASNKGGLGGAMTHDVN